jgi:hypothetical protein
MADYRASVAAYRIAAVFAIVASFASVRVSEPTAWSSMALSGVAGFAAAMNFSYSATDGFTSSVDNFVSVIIGFAAMAEYFIIAGWWNTSLFAGYNFLSPP